MIYFLEIWKHDIVHFEIVKNRIELLKEKNWYHVLLSTKEGDRRYWCLTGCWGRGRRCGR